MMNELNAARDALALIPGVQTCAVGLEEVIEPADYPLIRIVPSRITPGKPYAKRSAETLIYFGAPVPDSKGLPAVYAGLFAMEAQIRATLSTLGGRYLETVMDEDRIYAYKLMAVRCELIEG